MTGEADDSQFGRNSRATQTTQATTAGSRVKWDQKSVAADDVNPAGDEQMRRPTIFSLLWLGCAMLCAAASFAVADESASAEQLAANAIRAGQTRDISAVRSLAESLSHETPIVRQSCAWALSQFGESATEAVPALTRAMDDSEVRVRWAAVTALGRIGRLASPAESALWHATLDRDLDVCCAALIALRTVSVTKHNAALSALRECLRSPVADVQAEAIATLAAVHSRWDENEKLPIASQLATVFARSDDDLRLAVAVLLGDFGLSSTPAITALAGATDDIYEHVQAATLRAVGRFADEIDQRWNQLDAKQRHELRLTCEAAARMLNARGRDSVEVAGLAEQYQRLIDGIQLSPEEAGVALQRAANSSAKTETAATPENSSAAIQTSLIGWCWAVAVFLTVIGLWGLRQGLAGRLAASVQSTSNPLPEVVPMRVTLEADASRMEIAARSEAINSLSDSVVDAVSPFVQALQNDDARVRQAAAVSLGKNGLGAIDAVPQLIFALADADAGVRAAAAFALSVFGAHAMEAVPALRAALFDEFAAVRARAAFALGQIGPSARRAVEELARLVSDPDVSVRRNSASALGGIGADTVVVFPALRQAASDVDAGVRQCAVTTLAMIDTGSSAAASQTPQNVVDGGARQGAQFVPGGDGPQQALGSDNESEELRAINPVLVFSASLATVSSAPNSDQVAPGLKLFCPEQTDEPVVACEAVEPLEAADFIAQLEDTDADVRWNATQGLGSLGASAVSEMIASLNHRNPAVRRLLIVALGHVGAEARSAMPVLLVALHDVNADVRCAAADCLGQLGVVSRSMVQALVQSLSDPNAEVRRYVATTLGRFGQLSREATTALKVASISDISAKVRTAAQTALQRISESLVGAA